MCFSNLLDFIGKNRLGARQRKESLKATVKAI